MRALLHEHPIRFMALICIAAIAIFLGYLAVWYTNVVASPDWCAKAIQAERITPGTTFVGLVACIDLLKIQVQSIADTLKIVVGSFSIGLIALVVIVLAGAKGSATLPGGAGFNLSPADAADAVAGAADKAAGEVKQQAAPAAAAEPAAGPRPAQ